MSDLVLKMSTETQLMWKACDFWMLSENPPEEGEEQLHSMAMFMLLGNVMTLANKIFDEGSFNTRHTTNISRSKVQAYIDKVMEEVEKRHDKTHTSG